MTNSDDFLRELRNRRLARERRDTKIAFAVLFVSLVVSSILWFVLGD